MSNPSLSVLGREMLSFGLIGVIGFVVDAGTLDLALLGGLGLYFGRVVSYMAAVSTTWALNRRFTFDRIHNRKKIHEWARFVVSQIFGATINLGVYALLVHSNPFVARYPVIGVAAGSLSGLLMNFWVARAFVFRR